jgi:hypothetical protein
MARPGEKEKAGPFKQKVFFFFFYNVLLPHPEAYGTGGACGSLQALN